MARNKNHVLYPATQEELYRLKGEYEWIGREVDIVRDPILGDKLVVLALPRKYKKKEQAEAKLRAKREAYEEDPYI